jgi:nucleoside-diphosphate-sugar epimerase
MISTCNKTSRCLAMKNVLVTGATGFIGLHVAKTLLAQGVAVRCLVHKNSRFDFLNPFQPELVQGDILLPETLRPALQGIDAIVHSAGLKTAPSYQKFLAVNEAGCRNLYRVCAQVNPGISRIVHISSLAALGPSRDGKPLTEEHLPKPISYYGKSKLAGQRIAESFMKDLPISILLPPAVYGPFDKDFLTYFRCVKRGIMPVIAGHDRFFSIIYVKDAVAAVLTCLTSPKSVGKKFLIEDDCTQSWSSMAKTICTAMGKAPLKIPIPLPVIKLVGTAGALLAKLSGHAPLLNSDRIREFLEPAWICSSQRIRQELGFQTRYPLREGVRETVNWYRENGWL